jgi:hypothetical protein
MLHSTIAKIEPLISDSAIFGGPLQNIASAHTLVNKKRRMEIGYYVQTIPGSARTS